MAWISTLEIQSSDVLAVLQHELHEQGIALWLANVHGTTRKMIEHVALDQEIGGGHLYRTINTAVQEFEPMQGLAADGGKEPELQPTCRWLSVMRATRAMMHPS